MQTKDSLWFGKLNTKLTVDLKKWIRRVCTNWSGHKWQLEVSCTRSAAFENMKKLKIQFFLSANSTLYDGSDYFFRPLEREKNKKVMSQSLLGVPTNFVTSLSYFSHVP